MTESEANGQKPRSLLRRMGKAFFILLWAFVILCTAAWSVMFLLFSPLESDLLRRVLAGVFVIGTLLAFIVFTKRWRTTLAYLVVFAGLVAWYYSIAPSNDRDWATEVSKLASADINGNLVTIRNIRNFDYRSVKDFTPAWYDRTFDLDKLRSVDMMIITWGSKAIAHVIVSFGFEGDQYVAFSIEMRDLKGQKHSMLRSFFRNYELTYVVADERDVVRVRTNYREPHEQVHLFRTRMPVENARKLFMSYVEEVDRLSREPAWYNALEDNCTTGVLQRIHQAYKGRARYNWKILLPGYAGEYAYDCGMLDSSMPFAELNERCLINARAEAADKAPDFSKRIREGVPMPAPFTMQEFLSGK